MVSCMWIDIDGSLSTVKYPNTYFSVCPNQRKYNVLGSTGFEIPNK